MRLASTPAHRRFLHSQLNPGNPAAHRRVCLVLLRSRPDTVHRDLLRRTQTSSPLMKRCSTDKEPRFGITPAVADCRYRAPLSPRLHGIDTIPIPESFVKLPFKSCSRITCEVFSFESSRQKTGHISSCGCSRSCVQGLLPDPVPGSFRCRLPSVRLWSQSHLPDSRREYPGGRPSSQPSVPRMPL